RAGEMQQAREALAHAYHHALGDLPELELPIDPPDRLHAWHLFPVRLHVDRLAIDRNALVRSLAERGVGCSVHWRPLHLHPYYGERFGCTSDLLPVASREWARLVSLPLFPDMRAEEHAHVVSVIRYLCACHRLAAPSFGRVTGAVPADQLAVSS